MQVKCEYCGNYIDETLMNCPSCGAPNKNASRSANGIPKTIEELKAFAVEKGLPLEKMRFFIGEDYRAPRAFGIYKEPNGEVVVYKNKANGQRTIRYRGTDEAYGVNELYQKMRAEVRQRKSPTSGRNPRPVSYSRRSSGGFLESLAQGLRRSCLVYLISMLIVIAFVLVTFFIVRSSDGPSRGYYSDSSGYYYHTNSDWYFYNDGWEPYDSEPAWVDDADDYFSGYSYSESYGVDDFSDSGYYSVTSEDDWSDDDWDDDDWDYDSDDDWDYDSDWDSGWDSSDTDWDSDW